MPVTKFSSSSQANVDLDLLKDDSQRQLLNILSKFDGPKTILWDDKLIGPFEFVASTSLLKKHNVSQMHKLSTFRKEDNTSSNNQTLFLLRSDYHILDLVAKLLRSTDRSSLNQTSLIFVPHKIDSSIKYLKHHKVEIEKLKSIDELPIQLYVLDTDLLSLENNQVFKQVYLEKDYSCVKNIVDSIVTIQKLYGITHKISGQGPCAEMIKDQLVKKRKFLDAVDENSNCPIAISPKIHQILLIDRNVDLLTPLLTQLTYEGILDEVIGIEHGRVELPDKKVHKLHSAEELYSKLRDSHINAVATILKQTARNLQQEYEESQAKIKTIHEMRKIVQRIPYLKKAKESHANHLGIAELISKRSLENDFIYGLRIEHELLQEGRIGKVLPDIETKLLRQEDPIHILRLICAHSITSSGLKQKVCDIYKRELLQNAGFHYLKLLNDLSEVKLLQDQEESYESFSTQRDKCNLITENVDELNPNHPSYVYGGYLPYTIHLARQVAQSDNIKLTSPAFTTTDEKYVSPSNQDESRIVLVYFIGGCTFAEISALRFLSQQEDNNCEFIIATTNITNGNSLIQSLMDVN